MQNLKTVAAASALLGGLAMFLWDASRTAPLGRVQVSAAPARFTAFNARPLSKRRLALSSTNSEVELVGYSAAPRLLAALATQQALANNLDGTAAKAPKLLGLFADKDATTAVPSAANVYLTSADQIFVKVEFAESDDMVPEGILTVQIGKVGSVREARIEIKDSKKKYQVLPFDVSGLEMKHAEEVRLRWDPSENGPEQLLSPPSNPVNVWIDNVPPRILSVRLIGEAGGVGILEIQFANNDLKADPAKAPANFLIRRTGGQHEFKTSHSSFTILDRTDDSYVVQLNLGSLITDLYQIEVSANVTDRHDNHLADPRKFTFNSMPDAVSGPHVSFPDFVNRKERQPQDVFNPGDKVETRVARLYYTRDAHRVAQIINRNVKSYNQSGVESAKLTAKNARETAEQASRDRQIKERDAIRAVESNRQLEHELAGARQYLEEIRGVLAQRSNSQTTATPAPVTGPASSGKPSTSPGLSDESLLAAVRTAAAQVAELERVVADKRQIENDKREKSEQAQELEDRARENQFRAELAAGTADPDTYVPGDVNSVDPVTQVSVSVIGEGLLQLRGPIRGINKIRTMINQIDSPLGQVKVGIFTVQVNGEHGDRMEKVATRIEGHIDLSRFLTNQSLGYLRRAIQEVAGAVVANIDAQFPDQHRQIDRDRKYLYAFFGRDFIDELYEMDSEFLRTENKLLSLHGMDTISQSQACFIMALSKNDIRQQILDRFRCLIECELPQAEWDYRKTSSLLPCKLNSQKEVLRNAFEKYKFRNVHGFFEASVYGPDTMTPMQREFIRLAQIFKSQLVAEVELKQRVIERGMIEDAANDEAERAQALESVRKAAMQRVKKSFEDLVAADDRRKEIKDQLRKLHAEVTFYDGEAGNFTEILGRLTEVIKSNIPRAQQAIKSLPPMDEILPEIKDPVARDIAKLRSAVMTRVEKSELLHPITKAQIKKAWQEFERTGDISKSSITTTLGKPTTIEKSIREDMDFAKTQLGLVETFVASVNDLKTPRENVERNWEKLNADWLEYEQGEPKYIERMRELCTRLYEVFSEHELRIAMSEHIARRVRREVDHRKLLEFLIDEQEEKYIELVEGTRSHIAQIDNYLKRLAIALEDDFKVQFYDPGFAGVRAASREWDVNLGQVERTTILTNNRQFAKVSPQATMEFDLPKRAPMIVEGMNGARALVQEYGTLLQDPTFLSLSGMMSGSPVSAAMGGAGTPTPGLPNQGLRTASVRNVLPGQSTDSAEQLMSQTGGPDRKFGTALEGLIPDPAIYKFETGTGFEIRPVIQPDGHSVIYDFDYMYTTNVREPVRPDEKHLGRVKRHFIHTQVQTSSFELREISRYQVALKVSRTSRGVPLLEDIPGAGVLFRPLPSDESSLQQNIILAQSTVYPTMFDLMGLRWSKYVADLDHINLRDLEHVTRGREQSIHDFTFDEASKRVNGFLGIADKEPDHMRPDFYHQQRQPSPYHPGGYQYKADPSPTELRNRNFTIPDRRPEEYRVPTYDALRRNPIDDELRQIPTPGGQPEGIDLRLVPPEPVQLPESSSRSKPAVAPNGPTKNSAAMQNPKSSEMTIRPANFEQSATPPRVISDNIAGQVRASTSADQPTLPTPSKKKSWLSGLKPPFSKSQHVD